MARMQTSSRRSTATTNSTDVSLEVGTWGSSASIVGTELLSVIDDVTNYLGSFANDGKSSSIFGYNGNVSVGLYIGGRLEKSGAATVADEIRSFINQKGASNQMAIQYCGKTSNNIVGLAISIENDLPAVQQLVKTWSLSGCAIGFDSSESRV